MTSNSLHIELPPEQRASLVPWLIVAACAAVLTVLLSQLATSIPASLAQQAQSRVDAQRFPDVQIVAKGRDMQLTGSILVDQSPTDLIDQIRSVDGVGSVFDSLSVVDPAREARLRAEQFTQTLANIDVDRVAFQPGSIAFTPESDAALAQLLALLEEHSRSRIRIEGHTDNTGPDAVNLRMSRDRASAVANYLMARGIAADQLIVTGYGSTQPIASNDTDEGRARNRRIEISPVN